MSQGSSRLETCSKNPDMASAFARTLVAASSALSMAAASLIPASLVLDPCFLVEKPPDDYICQVCMNVLRQPTSGLLPTFTHFCAD